ncbi:MAG: Rpp14/Pop5 family protein [Zestosphaera sp.]
MLDSALMYEALLAVAVLALAASVLALFYVRVTHRKLRLISDSLNSRTVRQVIRGLEARTKPRRRYIIVRFVGLNDNLDCRKLQEYVDEAFIELYGKLNYSKASPKVLYLDTNSSRAIIRVRAQHKWKVLTALAVLERKGLVASLIPERTTGTYKKARKYLKTP